MSVLNDFDLIIEYILDGFTDLFKVMTAAFRTFNKGMNCFIGDLLIRKLCPSVPEK